MKRILILFLTFIFIAGCDSTEPNLSSNLNEVTLNNKNRGFSFSKGSVIPFSDSSTIPDFQVYVNRNINTILGVNLSSVGTIRTTFILVKEFNQTDSATFFFNNLIEVPDSNYLTSNVTIQANQIWAIKTKDDKFAKILIKDTDAREESTSEPGIIFYYAEVVFKWKYQPNGSRFF